MGVNMKYMYHFPCHIYMYGGRSRGRSSLETRTYLVLVRDVVSFIFMKVLPSALISHCLLDSWERGGEAFLETISNSLPRESPLLSTN